jgi:hypothetical protein
MSKPLYLHCPHCQGEIVVFTNEINCAIFRHGLHKNGLPVHPHAPKSLCDRLVETNQVYGCCKPFEVVKDKKGNYQTQVCDYK